MESCEYRQLSPALHRPFWKAKQGFLLLFAALELFMAVGRLLVDVIASEPVSTVVSLKGNSIPMILRIASESKSGGGIGNSIGAASAIRFEDNKRSKGL